MKFNSKTFLLVCGLSLATVTFANSSENNDTEKVADKNSNGHVGKFTAEGKTFETKFVRVLFAAEGSETANGGNSITPLVYDSVDPKGNKVKVRRFQITTKNTGYDEVQVSQEQDYKMKSVEQGVKLHIEIPVTSNGNLQLEKAYVGNGAYNFGTRETRQNMSPENASDLKISIKKLELPKFPSDSKPGDKGLVYNQGNIEFTFTAKVKEIGSDKISDFTVAVKGPISITHIRGKEREKAAVNINADLVAKNK